MHKSEHYELTPGRFIREHVFKLDEKTWAEKLNCTLMTVRRYDDGYPLPRKTQEKILLFAKEEGIHFDANWFFQVPGALAA